MMHYFTSALWTESCTLHKAISNILVQFTEVDSTMRETNVFSVNDLFSNLSEIKNKNLNVYSECFLFTSMKNDMFMEEK